MAAGVPCSPFRSATPHSTASRARRFPLQMIFNCSIFDGNHCSNLDGSGHPAQLQKFKDSFLIASCVLEGAPEKEWFWMIIRKLPKKRDRKLIIEDVDLLLEMINNQITPALEEDQSNEDLPGLTADEVLEKLVNSDFDLNTLDEWDKIRSN